jgi:hypothetical protein
LFSRPVSNNMRGKKNDAMPITLTQRVLQLAAEISGGRQVLARRLQVPVSDMGLWLIGEGRPPQQTFLKAVDILVENTPLDALQRVQQPAQSAFTKSYFPTP